MILGRLGKGYCKKNRALEFLARIFGYVASAPLSKVTKKLITQVRRKQCHKNLFKQIECGVVHVSVYEWSIFHYKATFFQS